LTTFRRSEVEEAFRHFMAVGESADWNTWADLHTEDGIWVEHHLGTFRGREEIRKGIIEVMSQSPEMEFPVEWCLIDGNRLVYYPWQVFKAPPGRDGVYRFGCVSVMEYAGNGLWSFQEDLYNPREAEQVLKRWLADGGKLPGRRG
jgi:ketosteroid isomerase-like protein